MKKTFICLTIAFVIAMVVSLTFKAKEAKAEKTLNAVDDATQYVGYGYNIAGGKALCDTDALYLNNPILDISNPDLYNKVKMFSGSNIVYESSTSSSVQSISETYGKALSGGGNVSASACFNGVVTVNASVDTRFDTTKNSSWTSTATEEYSYYSIFAKMESVVLQISNSEMKNYLSENFKNALYNAKTEEDIKKLFDTYGTHLLTGYTLGGVFEMTNYFATCSSSYEKENTSSFSTQAQAGISAAATASASTSANFSFNESYGSKDNNAYAVNNYKCTTYGGKAFTGLTMDQAFSKNLITGRPAYEVWTESMNNYNNLVIVDIPQSADMIPLWNLLPTTSDYNELRNLMINTYISICGGKYKEFQSSHNDVRKLISGSTSAEDEGYGFEEKGYQVFVPIDVSNGEYYAIYETYTGKEAETLNGNTIVSGTVGQVSSGSTISLDYVNNYIGVESHWVINPSSTTKLTTIGNARTGSFTIGDESGTLVLDFYIEGVQNPIYRKKFIITSSDDSFLGGDGTKENPYLIANEKQFKKISEHPSANFRLVKDIVFSTSIFNAIVADFSGTLDGNYHSISFNINSYGYGNTCLFTKNSGTIKNLTIKDSLINCVFSDSITRSGATSVAIIGTNTGVINNCVLDGVVMYTTNNSSQIGSYTGGVLNVGFVGLNQGIIEYGKITNSSFYAYRNDCKEIYVGGFAGRTTQGSSIKAVEISSSLIYSQIGNYITSDKTYTSTESKQLERVTKAYSGGIAGMMDGNATISDSLVYSFNKIVTGTLGTIAPSADTVKKSTYKGIIFAITAVQNDTAGNSDNRHYVYAGGIVGYEHGGSIERSVVYNAKSIHALADRTDDKNTDQSGVLSKNQNERHAGIFAGLSDNGSKIANSYAQSFNIEAIPDGEKVGKLVDQDSNVDGITAIVRYTDCTELDTDIIKFDSSTASIKLDEVTVSFDASNAKTDFLITDSFSCGNLKIVLEHSNENVDEDRTTEVKDFTIKYGKFYSATIPTSGIKIQISAMGANASYNVSKRNPVAVDFKVEVKEDLNYFVDDSFDPNILSFKSVLEDGTTDASIGLDDPRLFISYPEKLSYGENIIAIQYGDYERRLIVNARNKLVDKIEVSTDNAKSEYIVGDTDLNLENVKVTAFLYETDEAGNKIGEACEKEIPMNELSVIYSTVSAGENKVTFIYDDFAMDSMNIYGVYSINEDYVNELRSSLEKIEEAITLDEKYDAILKAIERYQLIKEYESSDISELKAKLEEYIAEYNELVDSINGDFEKAIESSNTFNYTILMYAGISVFVYLLYILKKRIFNF